MADVGPDWRVIQQKMRFSTAMHAAKIEQYKHELMQMRSQIEQFIRNIKASEVALEESKTQLRDHIDEHGEAPPLEY
jgi:uncharacterized protein YecA (UPF0149 family)